MIDVKGLTKRFEGTTALSGVNMRVPCGSVYGLVGPNGAGKSTLLRILCGAYRQDEGEVLIGGSPVYEDAAVKARIVAIPDDLYFFPQASLADMRALYRRLYPRFDARLYDRLAEVFPLETDKPIRRMSKGMQKQAALWLALCTRADVLLLDEPVDGLDPVMRRQLWSLLLGDVAERGTTVLVSSHNLRELEDVCDHVGILHRGKLLLERSLAELQDNVTKVQIAFDGDPPRLPEDLCVLHRSSIGRVHTLIARDCAQGAAEKLSALCPLFIETAALTLEEIFIYELEGEGYAVKDILL